MKWETAKIKVEVVSTLVSTLALVAGGIYALIQYADHLRAERAKESLAFVERYYKSPVLDAQVNLSTAWSREDAALRQAVKKEDKQYTQFIVETIASQKLEPHLFTMIGFYEGIGLCTRHDWCDRQMAAAFFCERAWEFFSLHYRYIENKREQWGNQRFAEETERFVYRTCKSSQPANR